MNAIWNKKHFFPKLLDVNSGYAIISFDIFVKKCQLFNCTEIYNLYISTSTHLRGLSVSSRAHIFGTVPLRTSVFLLLVWWSLLSCSFSPNPATYEPCEQNKPHESREPYESSYSMKILSGEPKIRATLPMHVHTFERSRLSKRSADLAPIYRDNSVNIHMFTVPG